MVTVVTREANGIPLTHQQVDDNFTDLAEAVNNIGADVIAEAVDAKDVAVAAANAAQGSALSAANAADASAISRGDSAASAEQAATSASAAAASAASVPGLLTAFYAMLAAIGGSALIGWISGLVGAIARTVQDKLRESVSIEDFGAVDGSLANASPALALAIATGKAVDIPGQYVLMDTVSSALEGICLRGKKKGYSGFITKVPTGYCLDFSASTAKGNLSIRHINATWGSGTRSFLKLTENLSAFIEDNALINYFDYAINAEKSDGLVIRGNQIIRGSIKCYSEMDRLVIKDNDIQAAPNHPSIEVYGGAAISIKNNFINWGNFQAIVLGYDSVRGDYATCPSIKNNYVERNCQSASLSAPNQPFIHIGAPYDQNGTAYSGSEVVRFPTVEENYINADVLNPNVANVIPVLFERALEGSYNKNRALNFTLGGAAANGPRVKFPAQFITVGNLNVRVTDISTGGPTAFQQIAYPAFSRYRSVEIFLGTVSISTNGSGVGTYNFTGIDTGIKGLDTGRLIVTATPDSDARVFVNTKSISALAGTDGADLANWRINVAGGAVSTTVPVEVRALVTVP